MAQTIKVNQTGKTTLTGVANYLGVSLDALKAANPQLARGKNFNLIYPEDVINIPTSTSIPTGEVPVIPSVPPSPLGKYKTLYNAQGDKVDVLPAYEQDARNKGYVYDISPSKDSNATVTLPPPPEKSLFKDSASYKTLPVDLQGLVDSAFSFFMGTPEQQKIFINALTQAQALADPYSKAQLALFKGEFESKIAFSQGDLERASLAITTARDDIREMVRINKEFLTLEQQADLAREETKYSTDLLDIADQAAEKGLTFATGARSRALVEERRGVQYQDVIQSTQRKTNLQLKELELRAARGETDAAQQLADIKAKSTFQLEDIGRSAEKVLGSAGAATLTASTGYTPVGGVLGDIEQERRKAIIDAASLAIPK